ncbi:dnaJ homolog subfamily A member 3, mitochondrial-like isoform X2 [Dysidea avara]|uniref:dnaJ homolog subfamily A member 3, mitochondrial-like isoform X2 n=1 Tax=Dysidea avara TaxID=196820 RepID=UPI00332BFD68
MSLCCRCRLLSTLVTPILTRQGGVASSHVRLRPPYTRIHTSAGLLKKDYYEVLDVPRDASTKDIKRAYYELAKKYHPDHNKDEGAAAKFTEVGEAYEVLSDGQKRANYDAYGHSAASSYGSGAAEGGGFTANHAEEIFRQFFGQGFSGGGFDFDTFQQSSGSQNSIHQVPLNLSFGEAVEGCVRELAFRVQDVCERCSGTKAEPGTKRLRCPYCGGKGEEIINTGFFHMRSPCRNCRGEGYIINTPCHSCRGSGRTLQTKRGTINIPAGVSNGQTIRVMVDGIEVLATLSVEQSRQFRRDGFDVHSNVTISFTQAILGGTVRIDGLTSSIDLKIPAGVQSHHRIRLSGRGIPKLNRYGSGDHYVHVKIAIPKRLTSRQKELIVEFAESERHSGDTKIDGVTDKVRERNEASSEG